MAKPRTSYVCGACGARTSQWQGQCVDCEAWNTLEAVTGTVVAALPRRKGPAVATSKTVIEVTDETETRASMEGTLTVSSPLAIVRIANSIHSRGVLERVSAAVL